MNKHRKAYKMYGEGVELLCGKRVIMKCPSRFANFSIDRCGYCGAEVRTTGDSPDTDRVSELTLR